MDTNASNQEIEIKQTQDSKLRFMDKHKQSKKSSRSSSDEVLEAKISLSTHMLNYVDSMSLKCAIELGIPDAINNHGGPIALSDLLSSLSISSTKKSQFQRLMRALTHSGIFRSTDLKTGNDDQEDQYLYSLTPISSLLVNNNDAADHASQSQFVLLQLQQFILSSFHSMSAWFKDNAMTANRTPFGMENGCEIFEMTARNPDFNKLFNDAMKSHTGFWVSFILKECAHVFEGVTSLVDVGGGTGDTTMSISKAFPDTRCSVLELPAVVSSIRDKGDVDFVCGDMFNYIPRAHAVLLKCILHDWNDKDCVRILKRCKEAIPCREEGGKVIIIDMVMGCNCLYESSSDQAQIFWDIYMMVVCGGAERNEKEWKEIFINAGFNCYKIVSSFGVRSIIELYP